MNEIQIYATLREVLKPLLVADYPGSTLMRSYQDRIQGVPSTIVVYMTSLFDKRYGFPRTDYVLEPAPGGDASLIDTDTVQVIETRMQFMGICPTDPENENLPTGEDVLRRFAMYLSANAIIAQLRKRGLNVLRIEAVNVPRFTNDSDAFQAHPTFDVVLQHQDTLSLKTHAVDGMEYEIHSV